MLVVEFIPKRIRFELPFICCGGHFRKQIQYMYVFSRLLLCRLCCLHVLSLFIILLSSMSRWYIIIFIFDLFTTFLLPHDDKG